ncbi:MAG TPA: SDR family oxidoreductase [bacterium]|nr:SDR family oxidoreductase [bacterium]
MSSRAFEGKVALITGSSRGIGLATACRLAGMGAKVALNGRNEERLKRALEKVSAICPEAIVVAGDVSDPESAKRMIEETVEKLGGLDILINNAGVSMRAALEELDAETCGNVVDVNLKGCIYPTFFALPHIKKSGGSIIFISSIAGLIGLPTASLYCATKMALRGFADSLRCELEPQGVHIGTVYVGFTENDPDKKVIGASGEMISPGRSPHGSKDDVAREIAKMLMKRKREVKLTPIGKLANVISRVSPVVVEKTIIFSRKHNISEKLGIR